MDPGEAGQICGELRPGHIGVRLPFAGVRQRHPAVVEAALHGFVAPVALQLALVKGLRADGVGREVDTVVFGRVIDRRGLGRDAAAQQKLLHSDEFIALGQQIVDGGQRAVDARAVDIVDEDDRAVKDASLNVLPDGLAVAVFPVLRVDRPVDEWGADDGADGLVRVAVGGADVGVLVAARGGDEGLDGVDLRLHGLRRAGVEIFVVVCMVCQLMALADDAPERLRPAGGVDAVDEERRVYAALGQTVEQVGGIFARAVVKRDGQQLRAAVLRLRGSGRQDQRGEQQQNQQQRYELMDRSHMGSPFCRHHSRIREKSKYPADF